jgi:hypothetical protein
MIYPYHNRVSSPATKEPVHWLVFGFSLPMQPAYARVKIWRHLQSAGAITLGKNSVYLLPAGESMLQAFEWVLTEARAIGGNAVILDATTALARQRGAPSVADARGQMTRMAEPARSIGATISSTRPLARRSPRF